MKPPSPAPPGEVIHFLVGSEVIMTLDAFGMTYKGQRINDAGAAQQAWLGVMRVMREAQQPQPLP